MITKTFKTTSGKIQVFLPSILEEITLGQMTALQQAKQLSDLDAISILSGIPVQELAQVKDADALIAFANHLQKLAEQIRYSYNSDSVPKQITFNIGRKPVKVTVSGNLSIEPAGAFMAARNIISEEITTHIQQYGEKDWKENFNPSLQASAQILGHYFFCRVTGKPYNEYEAEEFIGEIKKLRVTEALPVAKHFFTCYPALLKPKTSCFHRLLQRLKKKPAYRPLKNLSISTP